MTLYQVWSFISALFTAGSILIMLAVIYWTIRGLIPPLVRLGYGLQRKRIVIVAYEQHAAELSRLIQGTKLFNKNRIQIIAPDIELDQISKADVVLTYFSDCQGAMEEILNRKRSDAALIVYAPPPERVPSETMTQLAAQKHVLLCNFRGRLMNDILTSMMTVAYDKG